MEHRYIHITGFAKGGTTFAKRCFRAFKDTWVAPEEPKPDFVVPEEVTARNIVVKSPGGGTQTKAWLERGAKVMYLLRDPRDKIASEWQYEEARNVSFADIRPGQDLLNYFDNFEELSADSLLVRYEDLCRNPDEVQKIIADYFDLEIEIPFSQLHTLSDDFDRDPKTHFPLGGAGGRNPNRPPDPSSIGQWKTHPCQPYAEEFAALSSVKKFLNRFYLEEDV